MENKIIHKFPLRELNLILGGIKERTINYFNLMIRKADGEDESLELIKNQQLRETDPVNVLRNVFHNFAGSFEITKREESILIINYLKVAKEVRRYFQNIEVDIENIYQNHNDIYDFMFFLNDNPVIKDLEKKVAEVTAKNGSIIIFNVADGNSFDELIYVDTPKDFAENNIMVNADKILFDNVIVKIDNGFHQYPYPFTGLKEKNYDDILRSKTLRLYKTLCFDVELDDDNPEFGKNGIYHYYTFMRRANILCEEIEKK
jgi:hypothetical protein